MAQSLQEQLLKAGLVSEKQVQEARRGDGRARKQNKKPPKKHRPPQAKSVLPASASADAPVLSEREREIAQARAAKIARDRALNQNRVVDAERKARRAQVRQMIEQHAPKPQGEADLPYHFQRGKKIKRIYVDARQREQLLSGALLLLVLDRNHHLLVPAAAARVQELAPDAWLHRHDPATGQQAAEGVEDDPYAEFKVPDDLMW